MSVLLPPNLEGVAAWLGRVTSRAASFEAAVADSLELGFDGITESIAPP